MSPLVQLVGTGVRLKATSKLTAVSTDLVVEAPCLDQVQPQRCELVVCVNWLVCELVGATSKDD